MIEFEIEIDIEILIETRLVGLKVGFGKIQNLKLLLVCILEFVLSGHKADWIQTI